MLVSVVVPVYNEEGNIEPLAASLAACLPESCERELIFVDDGSKDKSLPILRSLARKDPSIRYISFSRNFGHQTALRAGIEAARGDCVVMMDGDFQHPPSLMPALISEYEKGVDIVTTKRIQDHTTFLKRTTSNIFYLLVNALSDTKIEPGSADFRLLSRRARDVIVSMKEQGLFLRGAIPWTGLPSAEIQYVPGSRRSGASKFTASKMFSLAIDGITSFSVKPLRLTSFAGVAISGAGFLYALYALIVRIFTDRTVEGWTSLLISVLLIGGIQLLSLGIIGEYLGKLFMEAKGRPPYIVKEASSPTGPNERKKPL